MCHIKKHVLTYFSCVIDTLYVFLLVPDIKYEISAGNVEGAFAVNSKTGDIYVDSPLDFETKQKVTISPLVKY